ncbi:MAG: hypothetical protein HOL01_19730 [Planctomycetaceae bacterium]|jgi:hypothetical protein|nr:hypothetical protein [Planctomycetaceae bacterium]MBT6484968.1 hypothetical protein [Planctomycetaceae bacterium]MBT6496771.1 hypothetical protein [Planctomycetaceae bacterium]
MKHLDQRRFSVTLIGAILALCFNTADLAAQTPLLFVESYNKLLEMKKVAINVDYRIEGRISSKAPNRLTLQKCSQVFLPAQGETFGKPPAKHGVVEIFGRLQVVDRKRVIVVSSIRFHSDDAIRYELKKKALRRDNSEDWFNLAKWAGKRAEFYEDKVLRERTIEANRRGIELQRRTLPDVNATTLLALAKKAADLKLPDSIRLQFVHEAHRTTWEELQKTKRPDMKLLLDALKQQLPGVTERLPTPQPELEKTYRANPVSVYRQADEKARKKLHRIFYSDVLLASILQTAEADGDNGFAIADRVDETLPEQHELAERQREQEMKTRLSNIDRLTRQEMLDLADRFRRRKQPAKADEAVKKWLKATESQFRKEGPIGLLKAADEYIDLLEDRDKGVALLKEAYKLSPESERITERLTQLDYRLDDGEWVPIGDVKKRLETPIQKATREGRVIKGMTATQVRGVLGIATSVTRIATAGQVSELWIYGESNATRITVHLLRRTPRSPFTAVRVAQVSP